ncbi:hypothetical protein SDRG_12891 [Saprolegnia diclina VS20]|uniref:Uncharacterized protein n=1 Tax=Saprolegnia diclina (strain VS20) TaxID=1156394 RepID=T0RB88_SAPDV|nr:hypothetical protein SDRG_12891 [Saprolegnia diclina VS20]EQC29428.1 hypothetical protein SDRG_12891 [Saprolegnia diclina VS20]|eukprot:XP_008617195.1 hypothetical protein SDRG_12891 [Saprolegnia diclina VS20]
MYDRYQALTKHLVTCALGFRNAYDDDMLPRHHASEGFAIGAAVGQHRPLSWAIRVEDDIRLDALENVDLRRCRDVAVTLFSRHPIALVHAAAYGGHATLLTKTYLLDHSAGRGYLDVAMLLTNADNKYCTTVAMDGAIAHGHFKSSRRKSPQHAAILDFLVHERGIRFSEKPFALAAAFGDMRMVLACRVDGVACTTTAMDAAARNCQLEVLAFQQSHHPEDCSDAAFNDAAARGDLSTVLFLQAHYSTVGNLVDALTAAARRGRLEVVAHGCRGASKTL